MQRALFLAICVAWPFSGAAQDGERRALASLTAGVVCGPPVIGSIPAPDTLAGTTHIIADDTPFIAQTRQVPAVIGLGFGIKAQATNPAGLSAVDVTITHPPMGPDGMTRQSYTTQISAVAPSLIFYQFDENYEKVTGKWTFSAQHDGISLFSVSFDVMAPALLPDLAAACNTAQLLS